MPRETDLYPPIKAHFEAQGFTVKGEVGPVDVMARHPDGATVIVELKLSFTLALFHQATRALRITDHVYVAVAKPTGPRARKAVKDNLALCRRLGLGMITVRARDQFVEVHAEPGPYQPRRAKKRATALAHAFDRLDGDPNDGGATRHGIVTGYRQDALRCAAFLAENGPTKGAEVAKATQTPTATRIMADNHYGWFDRVSRGVYGLTAEGQAGLVHWAYSWED